MVSQKIAFWKLKLERKKPLVNEFCFPKTKKTKSVIKHLCKQKLKNRKKNKNKKVEKLPKKALWIEVVK